MTTSFMPLRGSQIKEYERMSEKVRGRKIYGVNGAKSNYGHSESPLKTQPSADREDVISPLRPSVQGDSGAYDLRTSVWSATAKDNLAPMIIN